MGSLYDQVPLASRRDQEAGAAGFPRRDNVYMSPGEGDIRHTIAKLLGLRPGPGGPTDFLDSWAGPYHETPQLGSLADLLLLGMNTGDSPDYWTEYGADQPWVTSNLNWPRWEGETVPTASPLVSTDNLGLPYMWPPFAAEALPGIDYLKWAMENGAGETVGPDGHMRPISRKKRKD